MAFVFEKITELFQEKILAFELINVTGINFIKEAGFEISNPFTKYRLDGLIDVDLNIGTINLQDIIEQLLYEMLSKEKIIEAFFSKNVQQRNEFWTIRELIPAANRKKGAICSNDISVPIDKIPEFIIKLDKAILSISKDIIVNCFGHLGDGNLHYNIFQNQKIQESS